MTRGVWLLGVPFLALFIAIFLQLRNRQGPEPTRLQKDAAPSAQPEDDVNWRPRSPWPPALSADADPEKRLPLVRSGDTEEAGGPSAVEPEEEARHCASRVDGECSFLHPSPEELVEMARCATIKSDYPEGLFADGSVVFPFPQQTIEAASISEQERELIMQATEEMRTEIRRQFEDILLDFGMSRQDTAGMSLDRMKAALKEREDIEDVQRARRQIARARAGLDRPLVPRTATEKTEHTLANLGEMYEQKLGQVLGSDRAAELRAAGDGWSSRSVAGGQCEPGNNPTK